MTTEGTTKVATSMSDHPDIVEIRDRLDRVSETAQAQTVEGLMMLSGLYVAISPWVVGFTASNTALTVSDLVVGLAIAILAMDLASAFSRAHGISWVLPVLGAWIIVGQFFMAGHALDVAVTLSNVIAGAVVLILGVGALAMQYTRMPRH